MRYCLICLLSMVVSSGLSQVDSLVGVASHFYEEENYSAALKHYRQAIKMDSSQIVFYEQAGISALKLGQLPEARALFIQLETRDSSNVIALRQLASIYEQEENLSLIHI